MGVVKHVSEFGTIWNRVDFINENPIDSFDAVYLDNQSFQSLKSFVAENNDPNSEIEQAFTFHRKRGRDFIKVKSYVGVIETRQGTVIEILPKVFNDDSISPDDLIKKSKALMFKMLRTLKNSPFKSMDKAHLMSSRVPILEIFITVFIKEMEILLKRGIKHYYNSVEDNQRFLKGRLLFSANVKRNVAHREKFFIHYDEFNSDIPQNRILKATLTYLKDKSRSSKNITALINLLYLFDDVQLLSNVEKDLLKISGQDRLFSHYQTVLMWAQVFLLNKSFLSYKGNHLNTAILFPMETLFESYVASRIKKYYPTWKVSTQDRKYYLLNDINLDRNKFRLRPDIVIAKTDLTLVLDTKWKMINQNLTTKNYNISQSDMYQLYAYGKKYQLSNDNVHLILIFPQHSNFTQNLHFKYESELYIDIVPFDFEDEDTFMNYLLNIDIKES